MISLVLCLPWSAFRWLLPRIILLPRRFFPKRSAATARGQSRRRRIHRGRHSSGCSVVTWSSSAVRSTPLESSGCRCTGFDRPELVFLVAGDWFLLLRAFRHRLRLFVALTFVFLLGGLFVKLGDDTVVEDYAGRSLTAEGDGWSLKTLHGSLSLSLSLSLLDFFFCAKRLKSDEAYKCD